MAISPKPPLRIEGILYEAAYKENRNDGRTGFIRLNIEVTRGAGIKKGDIVDVYQIRDTAYPKDKVLPAGNTRHNLIAAYAQGSKIVIPQARRSEKDGRLIADIVYATAPAKSRVARPSAQGKTPKPV